MLIHSMVDEFLLNSLFTLVMLLQVCMFLDPKIALCSLINFNYKVKGTSSTSNLNLIPHLIYWNIPAEVPSPLANLCPDIRSWHNGPPVIQGSHHCTRTASAHFHCPQMHWRSQYQFHPNPKVYGPVLYALVTLLMYQQPPQSMPRVRGRGAGKKASCKATSLLTDKYFWPW